jgi:putative transcriptional regulator
MSKQNASKRDLFAELMEGVNSMKTHRAGKITLRTHKLPTPNVPKLAGADFVAVREKFNVSRALWARMLHVSPRTVEKWEQGGAPSSLAATFVELVACYPDTIQRLQSLPRHRSQSKPAKSRKAAYPGAKKQRAGISVRQMAHKT